MSELQESISQVMEVTDLSRSSAEYLLKINEFDTQRAINYHLERELERETAGCSKSSMNSDQIAVAAPPAPPVFVHPNSAVTVSEGASLPDDKDTVRAPIPPKREQLLGPQEEYLRYRKRRAHVLKVCPLRNFAHEAEKQEEQLMWYLENKDSKSSKTRRHARRLAKRSGLDELFCPPIDLLFWGSFNAAREHASSQNRWLMVNLQDNTEFKSQILNRDIWPDIQLKDIVLKYFVLWQVSVDSLEGLRFKAFYNVNTMPYVCILDPRTGENRLICDVVTPQIFRINLLEFLNNNFFALERIPNKELAPYIYGASTSKTITQSSAITHSSTQEALMTSTLTASTSTASTSMASTSRSPTSTSPSSIAYNPIFELSEEDQLELAIKNSLNETRANDNSYEISDSENENSAVPACEADIENEDESQTKILLRLSAGERVHLEWKKTTRLRAIRIYIDSKYPDIAKQSYKLISPFPRQDILELDDDLTLEEAHLHPSAVLHLHTDNADN